MNSFFTTFLVIICTVIVLDGFLDDFTDIFLIECTEVADNNFGFQLFLTKQFVQFRGNSQDES